MSDAELQKVESVMFKINQSGEVGMGLLWKDGALYLSISEVMLTDGDRWYSIPFKDLKDIGTDEENIVLKIDGAEIRIKGENAERLMALRHLLLPLIDGIPAKDELMVDMIKILLIGIKEKEIIAALLKRSPEEVKKLMESAEKNGYVAEYEVTDKGKSLLSSEEVDMMRKAGVKI